MGAFGSIMVCLLREKRVNLQQKKASPKEEKRYNSDTMGKNTLPVMATALFLLCSCGGNREERRLLENIEQTWQQCESSLPEAQTRAERLRDSVQSSSEYVRQKYNLLKIRLRDKRDVIPSSPDSAMQVLSFFASRANSIDKERACYYAGSAYRDLKDYPRAVNFFLQAADMAKQGKAADTLIWQNSLSQLKYLYMLGLNYEEELKVALQAVELAASPDPSQRGVKRNLGCYLLEASSAYSHLNDTTLCLQYCDRAYRVFQEEHFPAKYGSNYAYMLAVYSKYSNSQSDNLATSQFDGKVDTLLRQLMQMPKDARPYNYELTLAMLHENANRVDSAILHYKAYYDGEASLSGRYEASAGLQRCYMQKGDTDQAAQWGCRLYETNDSIIAQRAFEQTQRARDEYIYHRDKEEERAVMQRDERIIFVSVITGLALVSIIMGLTALHYFRKKRFMEIIIGKDMKLRAAEEEVLRRQDELEQKNREIEQLGCQLSEAERTVATSKVRLESTMKDLEQKVMMNRELTRIALMNNIDEKAEKVIAHFREAAEGLTTLKPSSWKELTTAIEALYPGFLEEVQGRLAKQLREPFLYTICLLKIGLKPAQIARIMDAKIQTVWNRVKLAEEKFGDLLRWQQQ